MPLSEWGQTTADLRFVAPFIDRLTFSGHIVETGSESHRLRSTRTRGELLREPVDRRVHGPGIVENLQAEAIVLVGVLGPMGAASRLFPRAMTRRGVRMSSRTLAVPRARLDGGCGSGRSGKADDLSSVIDVDLVGRRRRAEPGHRRHIAADRVDESRADRRPDLAHRETPARRRAVQGRICRQ